LPVVEPLEGIRILDFSHMLVGPYCTLQLASFGAEVIKVESRSRPDPWRFRDGTGDPEQSGPFADHNRNKRSITLNLKSERGVALARELVRLSDVVIENFSADVMAKLGLEYETLRTINPKLIMLSLQGLGHVGPHAGYVTWGPNLISLSGMNYLWSLPDDPEPVGTQTSYPDFAVGLYAAVLIMGALFYREATGRGQYLDVSQAEVTAGFLAPSYMEWLANGVVPRPKGNSAAWAAPYGCYRCAGEDGWCVVAVETDAHWNGLLAALQEVEELRDPRFQPKLGRLRYSEELDRILERWMAKRLPEDAALLLQAHGVPASPVASGRTLAEDPHLQARDFLPFLTHPRMGTFRMPGNPVRLSGDTGGLRRHAPLLGQDNDYAFRDLLGLPREEIERLERDGVIG
jgi:crotonobetainyl-CoA:carnitine CoA-transferase CaiB-like acyl-CoA transferase